MTHTNTPDPIRFPPELLKNLGFEEVLENDSVAGIARVRYIGSAQWAHSGGAIIQGGYITAWLDNCMAFALAGRAPDAHCSTLEIKVSYFDRTAPGAVDAVARVRREGRTVAFMEADLFSVAGSLLASATSTVKLSRKS